MGQKRERWGEERKVMRRGRRETRREKPRKI